MTSSIDIKQTTNQSSVEDWPILEKTKFIQTEVEIKGDKSDAAANSKVISKRKWGKLNVDFKYASSDGTTNRPNINVDNTQIENKENFQQRLGRPSVRGHQYRNGNNNFDRREQLKESPTRGDTEIIDKNQNRPPRQFNKKYNGYRNENQNEVTSRTSDPVDVTKTMPKSPRTAAGTRGKRNFVGRGRNPMRYNHNKQNGNVDYLSMYPNYPTGIPMIMSTFNQVPDGINAGIMTTVSAGSLYNNQILFLPSMPGHGIGPAADYSQMVPIVTNGDLLHFGDDYCDLLLKQIEYYFSEANLRKDTYLRSLMDVDGWVSLLVIAGFKRIANFSMDVNNIANIVSKSDKLEVDTATLKVRIADRSASWSLPNKVNDQIANLNPHAPAFVPQNENEISNQASQEDMVFAFKSECPSFLNSAEQRRRMALQAKMNAKEKGRQRLHSSVMSEDDVDDSMLPYLVVITPELSAGAEQDFKGNDRKRNRTVHSNPSKSVSEKYLGGDRQPFYLIKQKMNSELADVIKLGLQEYEKEFLIKNDSLNTPRSRVSSTSETKGNVISQDFEVLSQTLSEVNVSASRFSNGPTPPGSMQCTVIPVSESLFGQMPPVAPTLIGIPASSNSLFSPGTYMYFPPVAAGQPAHITLMPQIPLSVSVCNPSMSSNFAHAAPAKSAGTAEDVQPLKSILKSKHDPTAQKPRARQIAGFYPAGSDRSKTFQQNNRRQRQYSEGENLQLETHVGFAFDTKESRSRTTSVSSDTDMAGKDGAAFGLRNHRSHAVLRDNGFTFQGYNKFRTYALNDRDVNGAGLSQEMNTLYRFWSFFLRENFNKSMFREFRNLAFEDADKGARYGLECLFRFYSYGMEFRFRKSLFKNFEEDTLKDFYTYKHKYGLEKFWAYLYYSKKNVEINPRLSQLLNEYKSLEDIRADFIPPDGFFIDRARVRSNSEMSANTSNNQ